MIYSFDIFDTLITRKSENPHDVFTCVELSGECPIKNFRKNRIEAERKARKVFSKEEITINDIYYVIQQQLNLSNETVYSLIQCELKAELQNSLPVHENIDYLNYLLNKNEKVILISDMYLSKEHIRKLLQKNNIPIDKLEIFISSEYNATKRTGKLFNIVVKKLNVNKSEIYHIGDNIKSDFVIPKLLGINARVYNKSHQNNYEKKLNTKNQKLADLIRYNRVIVQNHNKADVWNTALNVLAPITLGYIYWIKEFAINNKIDKLFFVSRDGQLMYKVWNILFSENNSIAYEYIYGSRKVWYLPSIINKEKYFDAISSDGWIKSDVLSLYDLFEQFGLDENDLNELTDIDSTIFEKKSIDILKMDSFIDFILRKASVERLKVKKYFEQIGILDSKRVALVDLGWTGKSLQSARSIIQEIDPNIEVYGIVLGKRNANKNMDWLHSWLISNDRKCLRSEVYLLETIYAADHETVIDYKEINGQIKPILKENGQIMDGTLKLIECQQYATCKLAEDVKKHNLFVDTDSNIYYEIFQEFVFNPTNENVNAYRDYPFSRDCGDKDYICLAKKLSIPEFIKELQVVNLVNEVLFHKKNKQQVFWLEATAKISGLICCVIVKLDNFIVKFIFNLKK